ncbi:MAG TPA: hypothetical protein VIZ22_07565 [Candidatus Limnocylindrales bacterium]
MTAAPTTVRPVRLAVVATGALVAGAIVLRLANPYHLPGPSVSAVVPLLWAAGALVVLLLTQAWAPTLGWIAAIVGSTAAALAIVGNDWEARRLVDMGDDRWLGLLVVAALLIPAVIAAAYAALGLGRAVVIAAWTAVGVLTVGLVSRYVARTLGGGDLDGTLPEWAWLLLIGLLAAIGLTRDLRPALSRTRVRLAAGDAGGSGRGGPVAALPALRVFMDELVPGRDAGRKEAVETERGRLAADLHAEVLPSLRRALAAAEAGGTVERLASDLRIAVDEVESMLLARRSIVLEEMGLLAGLEWLAERVEDRSDVRVEITVEGGGEAGATDRPPREAERAAFRVAQLALDNVVRHAPSSTAGVSVAVGPRVIRLRVEDDADSAPIDEAAAARSGRRGIADMRAEATACGGALEVWPGAGDRGTAIVFRWPA